MRVSELSRFPYPVLSAYSNDFASGEFDVEIETKELSATGALCVQHSVTLTEPCIMQLVESGQAAVGMFVRCDDTYYRDLHRLAWPAGRTDFPPGALLNRVSIRSFVWLEKPLTEWSPDGIHPEFPTPLSLTHRDVIAIGPERVISVGQAKLATLESIFELQKSDSLSEGNMRVNPDADRIQILADPKTFDTISLLREQQAGRAALLNSVFLPAVMEVLEMLRGNGNDFTERRWYKAFAAKCDSKGIDPDDPQSLFESAQRLLDFPSRHLSLLLPDAGGEA